MVLKIEPLDSRQHNRSDFCCGKASLDNYIRQQASQDLKKQVSTVFVLIEDELSVLGYYTLNSYTVNISAFKEAFAKRLPRYPLLPATLLGRLAVDNRHKGKKLGELLLVDSLQRALNTSTQVASLAVIAEALDENAINFYLKYSFQPFKQDPMKLYLPMKSIEDLF